MSRLIDELIRQHLSLEAEKFSRGEFDDPAKIHGMDMPGVQELSQGHQRIMVTYTETPTGAELRYTTPDPSLRRAIHDWFDRQVMDHGSHAAHG